MGERLLRRLIAVLSVILVLSCGSVAMANGLVLSSEEHNDANGDYVLLRITGLTPYVYVPTGAGTGNAEDYTNTTAMVERYGPEEGIVAAISGGIFYNAGTETQYCFSYKEPDGVVIADGVVLKSEESIDHSECDILVIDEDGAPGWADYYADADALAAGLGYYYDIYGDIVTGKRIVSALTGFVPLVVGGESVYDPEDELLNGYDNYVGHYSSGAARQVFGVQENGTYVILTNTTNWTLAEAAEAALGEGCVFAYNLDGGGSAETVTAYHENGAYVVNTLRSQMRGERSMPTFIVFTADNEAPLSAVPIGIDAQLGESFPVGTTLAELAARTVVTEYFQNADGSYSSRSVYSAQARDGIPIAHQVIGGSSEPGATEVKTESVSPDGTLYYVKTDSDTALSLRNNSNTRADGAYYDYSTGFSLATEDDLTTPGVKTLTVSYIPGADLPPLTCTVSITMY